MKEISNTQRAQEQVSDEAQQSIEIIKLKDSFEKLKNTVSQAKQKKQKFPLIVQMQKLTLEDVSDDGWQQQALKFTQTLSMVFSHSHFYNLEILRINDPVIDSMEFITFLDAPSLSQIHILQSSIVNVKPLNKTKFKFLQLIRLTENPITELNLSRTKFQASRCYLYLQQQDNPENTLMQDLSQLVKLQTNYLDQLFIEGSNRIFSPKLENTTLKSRFCCKKKDDTLKSVTIFNQFYDWSFDEEEEQNMQQGQQDDLQNYQQQQLDEN